MSSNTVGRASRPESRELARKGGSGEFISLFFLVFAERSERLESREKERREATFFSRVLSLLFFFPEPLLRSRPLFFLSHSDWLEEALKQKEESVVARNWFQQQQNSTVIAQERFKSICGSNMT